MDTRIIVDATQLLDESLRNLREQINSQLLTKLDATSVAKIIDDYMAANQISVKSLLQTILNNRNSVRMFFQTSDFPNEIIKPVYVNNVNIILEYLKLLFAMFVEDRNNPGQTLDSFGRGIELYNTSVNDTSQKSLLMEALTKPEFIKTEYSRFVQMVLPDGQYVKAISEESINGIIMDSVKSLQQPSGVSIINANPSAQVIPSANPSAQVIPSAESTLSQTQNNQNNPTPVNLASLSDMSLFDLVKELVDTDADNVNYFNPRYAKLKEKISSDKFEMEYENNEANFNNMCSTFSVRNIDLIIDLIGVLNDAYTELIKIGGESNANKAAFVIFYGKIYKLYSCATN